MGKEQLTPEQKSEELTRLWDIVDQGGTLSNDELLFIKKYDDAEPDEFPEKLHVKKPRKQLSDAQMAQRRANVKKINEQGLQTGPTTPEGKRRSAKNSLIHGLYAQSHFASMKPCRTTCSQYPCDLVSDEAINPGDLCLDKQNFVEAFLAIEAAVVGKDFEAFDKLLSFELTATLDMVRQLRESVTDIGVLVKSVKTVTTDKGTVDYKEYKINPAFLAYPKLISDLGLTFTEGLATPLSRSKAKTDENMSKNIADHFASTGLLKTAKQSEAADEDPDNVD